MKVFELIKKCFDTQVIIVLLMMLMCVPLGMMKVLSLKNETRITALELRIEQLEDEQEWIETNAQETKRNIWNLVTDVDSIERMPLRQYEITLGCSTCHG